MDAFTLIPTAANITGALQASGAPAAFAIRNQNES
jgi:hypothetical protein